MSYNSVHNKRNKKNQSNPTEKKDEAEFFEDDIELQNFLQSEKKRKEEQNERAIEIILDHKIDQINNQDLYLVKQKSLSYLHLNWYDIQAIYNKFSNGKKQIQQYHERKAHQNAFLFSEDLLMIDRILNANQQQYLIKWENSGYDECTWESKEDVDTRFLNLQRKPSHPFFFFCFSELQTEKKK